MGTRDSKACPPNENSEVFSDESLLQTAANMISGFAVDLYHQFGKEYGNLFFSPLSISSALLVAAEGARGKTTEEMGKVLRFPELLHSKEADGEIPWQTALIHQGVSQLNNHLEGKGVEDEQAIHDEIEILAEAHKALFSVWNMWEEGGRIKLEDLLQPLIYIESKFEALKDSSRVSSPLQSWKPGEEFNINWLWQWIDRIAGELNEARQKIRPYQLNSANSIWWEKTCRFRESYLRAVTHHYGTSGCFSADFKNNAETEAENINQWIFEQTEGKIKDMVSPGSLDNETRIVLANAIYFKGEWVEPFEESGTRSMPFFLPGGKKTKTDMMRFLHLEIARYAAFNADGSFFDTPMEIDLEKMVEMEMFTPEIEYVDQPDLYPGKDGFAMLELPYKGNKLAMILIAPNMAEGLVGIERVMTLENLQSWIRKLSRRDVNVLLPKFRMETSYEVEEALKHMGMTQAFSIGADFTGMCDPVNPDEQILLSKILHKAFIEVNEKGTEAAAATVVEMAEMALMGEFTPSFYANRPFLFLIYHKVTGTILFIGRMVEPELMHDQYMCSATQQS